MPIDSGPQGSDDMAVKLAPGVDLINHETIEFATSAKPHRSHYSFWRGEHTTFYPTADDLAGAKAVDHLCRGMPAKPFIDKQTSIVAFGSCFADNISIHLANAGYNIATKKDTVAHISRMGDGIVNTFAVLQQFEWAWEGKVPTQELWHGYDAQAAGYDEDIRLATKAMLDQTDVFIITLGLSEIWYDEPTGEVFWRAVPHDKFDPMRHKFRVATHDENLSNILHIAALVQEHRPKARLIFTLSPIPLTATFRDISCLTANEASKASLRAALDEVVYDWAGPGGVHYFPSYEIARNCFHHRYMEDGRHIHRHVIEFIMALFEWKYCGGLSQQQVASQYLRARKLDAKVGTEGHWSVDRFSLKYSRPTA